jgi:hypothetical protein
MEREGLQQVLDRISLKIGIGLLPSSLQRLTNKREGTGIVVVDQRGLGMQVGVQMSYWFGRMCEGEMLLEHLVPMHGPDGQLPCHSIRASPGY